jgi:hypothetical protein
MIKIECDCWSMRIEEKKERIYYFILGSRNMYHMDWFNCTTTYNWWNNKNNVLQIKRLTPVAWLFRIMKYPSIIVMLDSSAHMTPPL